MCFDMHQSEKLAVFVDDLRRNGFALLGPDMNRSEAEFTVEQTDEGYAVRYALAGHPQCRREGDGAIVAEREAHGPFESLEDLFRRMPPGRDEPAPARRPGRRRGVRQPRAQPRQGPRQCRHAAGGGRRRRARARERPGGAVRRRGPRRARAAAGRGRAVDPRRADGGTSARTSASTSPRIRSSSTARSPRPTARAAMPA